MVKQTAALDGDAFWGSPDPRIGMQPRPDLQTRLAFAQQTVIQSELWNRLSYARYATPRQTGYVPPS